MEDLEGFLAALSSGDDERAEALVAKLAARGPAVLPALQELLVTTAGSRNSQIDTRWWVLRALAEIPDRRVPPLLVAALRDDDPGVRQCAALGLREQPDPQAIPALVAALDDEDHLCVSLACAALVAIGPPAVPALLEIVQSGSRPARLQAVRALAAIADPRAIPALFEILHGDSALMAYWAEHGLDRMDLGMVFFKP